MAEGRLGVLSLLPLELAQHEVPSLLGYDLLLLALAEVGGELLPFLEGVVELACQEGFKVFRGLFEGLGS